MNPVLKLIVRFILLIIIALFYNNYRNNQCIKNQNCEPIFLTSILKFGKDYSTFGFLNYEIVDKSMNVNIEFDKDFDKNLQKKVQPLFTNSAIESRNNYIKYENNFNYELVFKDFVFIKKLKIENTKNFPVSIIPKMHFEPVEITEKIKIYNCFCGSSIVLQPYESRDLLVYYGIKESLKGKISFSFEDE